MTNDPTHAGSPEGASRLVDALGRMDALINWERDRSQRIRRDLEPVTDLLERLGRPHAREGAPRWIHVTGTKGKGSVVALVAEALSGAGLRVGTYGSPHVERVNERVRLDGREVSDLDLAQGLERAFEARERALEAGSAGRDATWFDTLTAGAFAVFGDAALDWVVCEVGLGGRLDSTNVIRPEVCVVTNIDLEHTHVLGDTHEAIAGEKGGILKPGATFVCGPSPHAGGAEARAAQVLLTRAAELGLEVHFPEAVRSEGFSARNVALARAVLAALGERDERSPGGAVLGPGTLDDAAVARAALPGRLELVRTGDTPVVLDGAHVPASVELALAEARAYPGCDGPPVVVLALAGDKDASGILKALSGRADRVVCTTIDSGRHLDASALCEMARAEGITAEAVADPGEAVGRAVRRAAPGWVLVIGSLYLAGAARTALSTGRMNADDRF